MIYDQYNSFLDKIKSRFERLYDAETSERCLRRFKMLIGRYELGGSDKANYSSELWNEEDVLLITYADSVNNGPEKPLRTLKNFLDKYLNDSIKYVHVLPFFPYSSDDGFSIIHYRQINPSLGDWDDIKKLSENFELMFDLVLNHVSSRSGWFIDYNEGILPAKNYFISFDKKNVDLSSVFRPRNLPLLTKAYLANDVKYVWTTFSEDQIDLNYANYNVLFEMLDILLYYVYRGARIIRLDAIAYLWKEIGTSCISLPQTHEVVKLMRDMLNLLAPNVLILTETNVPHKENISYFGDGVDESHMVYQFPLPPLTLYTIVSGDATRLTEWADKLELKSDKTTFFNFLASHDGIGVTPVKDILTEQEFDFLINHVKKNKGLVSYKTAQDGADIPYELNINYFDAVSDYKYDADVNVNRFICCHAILLSMRGIPAIYVHSMLGSRNYYEGVKQTSRNRSINREKLALDKLEKEPNDESSLRYKIFNRMTNLIKIRKKEKAFHPNAAQDILHTDKRVFALLRHSSNDGSENILALHNVSGEEVILTLQIPSFTGKVLKDLISGDSFHARGNELTLTIKPYQVLWIK